MVWKTMPSMVEPPLRRTAQDAAAHLRTSSGVVIGTQLVVAVNVRD
jgi:hypothetical protein